jgi:hypothetical protein
VYVTVLKTIFLVEWQVYEREKSVLFKHTVSCLIYVASVVYEGSASVVHWWNGTDRGKLKCSERNLSHYYIDRHRFHSDLPGIESVPSRWESGVSPLELICDVTDKQYQHGGVRVWDARPEMVLFMTFWDPLWNDCNFYEENFIFFWPCILV